MGEEDKNLTKQSTSFSLSDLPGLDRLLEPMTPEQPFVDDAKIRRLYLQASTQQWFAPQRIDFSAPISMDPQMVAVWSRFMTIFYTLEKMGLNVISNMMAKAVRKLKSDESAYYLTAQAFDEARHVFAIENYLKRLGAPPKYDATYHVLGQVASLGAYRVENWLFSTLFSENFASCFLRKARNSSLDDQGKEMCRSLLIDESRHLHFLNIVLPDVMENMSLVGRTYVKATQFFIMKFTETMARRLDKEGLIVGINRKELVEDAFANVEKAYDNLGVSKRYVWLPKIAPMFAS